MQLAQRRLNVQAHRIFGGESAANSEEAFAKARESGVKSIETDVFLSKDGVMFAIHGDDENGSCEMRRHDTPEGPWNHIIIGDLLAEEIDKLTYRHSEGHKIVRVTQIIEAFRGTDIVINVEIKEYDPKVTTMVVDAFHTAGMLNQLFISSFFHYHRKYLKDYLQVKNLPHVAFGFLSFSIYHLSSEEVMSQTMPGDAVTISQAGLRLHMAGYPELYRKIRERGLKFNVWFDGLKSLHLETLENYKHLVDLGIDTIITNCPTRALRMQEEINTELSRSIETAQ